MKKNNFKNVSNANTSFPLGHSVREFEKFKSKVANAVLDYMDSQSDSELLECLERSSEFLANILVQMENVINNQQQANVEQNDLVEISDDLFPNKQHISSNTIH